jgi:hypothetical protein
MAQDQEPHRILVTLACVLSLAVLACCSIAAGQSPEHREESWLPTLYSFVSM